MPKPSSSEVFVSAPLSNMSIAYLQSNENFIAHRANTPVPVQHQVGKYFTKAKADFFLDPGEKARRGDGAQSNGGGYTVSTSNYSCDVWAWHKDVGPQTQANTQSPLDWRRDAVNYCTQIIAQRAEAQFVTDVLATSIWGTDSTPSNLWSDQTASTPIKDVKTACKTILSNTGFAPNLMICSYEVWEQLEQHPELLDRIKWTSGEPLTEQIVARIFGVDRVLVSKAVKNTAEEGATATMAFHSVKDALVCYVDNAMSLDAPSAFKVLSWRDAKRSGIGMDASVTEEEIPLTRGGVRIEAEMALDNVITGTDLGYFFSNAVA